MKKFFTKKKIIWAIVIVLVGGAIANAVFGGNDASKNVLTETVKKQSIQQTVLATAQVVSTTDLSLSFKVNGIVQKINVTEGKVVKAGDVLATLEQKDQLASLTTARGSLASAQANLRRVLDGASSEEVLVAQRAVDAAQVTLDNAFTSLANSKTQQSVLVDNAYKTLLNSGIAATPGVSNTASLTATVSGTYTGTIPGQYQVSIVLTAGGARFQYSGLESGTGVISTSPQPLGTKGLYIKFSDTAVGSYTNYTWTVNIPNTESTTYITNNNAYQTSLETQRSAISSAEAVVRSAEVALSQAKAQLDLKKAAARPADVEAARAQVLSATGQVQTADAALENTILRAPSDGTITKVVVKVGELATALKEAVVLQDVGNLHLEANISEANIANVRPGQSVDVTFDALGPERHFSSVVQAVNPASDVVSGVVNYKITGSIQDSEEIKPGMTANMTILIAQKSDVLSVPSRAVVSRDGKKWVKVVTDAKKKTYEEVEVSTGLEADGGVVEITSGLSSGQEIVTLIKK